MVLPEAQTETSINYIEINSILDQHPFIRDALKGFLDKWKGSDVFQQAASDASADLLVLGPLKAAGKMAENDHLMNDAMELMKLVCEGVPRVRSRFEFLLRLHPEEGALMAVTREYLLQEIAEGLGFAQKEEAQKFLTRKVDKIDPKVHGLILERIPDDRASIYYSYKGTGPVQMGSERFPFRMWPPVILPEDNEIGLVLYFLTSSWGLINQERKSP